MAKWFKICILLPFLPSLIYPQYHSISFERISVEQGLSNSIVRSIVQDYMGFMWFATKEGLNKFDGYKFTIYRHNPHDSTSLGSNEIKWVYEDPWDNLWISTIDGGLNRYNREKDNFIRYMPDEDNPQSISNDDMQPVVAFQYGGKNVLWIGTLGGLNKMDVAAQSFTYYPHTKKEYPFTYVEAIEVDSNGYVWIGCTEDGLYRFDPWNEKFKNFQHDPGNDNSISDNGISALCFDSSGNLWVGTRNGGLNKFDSKTENFIHFQHEPDNPNSLSNDWITYIFEDRSGILWIGTAFGGLNRFNRETGQFNRYTKDPGDQDSLGDDTVLSIFEDNSGVLWVGTYDGIYKSDPGKNQFTNYCNIPGKQNSLSDSYINSILLSESKDQKILWVGTQTGGLNKIDRKTGEIKRYIHNPNDPKSIPSNSILALFEDRSGVLWLGSRDRGLIKYNQESDNFTQFFIDIGKQIGQSSNYIRTMYEDRKGTLWIGTQTGGLFIFDREKKKFSHAGLLTQVRRILEDKSGVFWIGTFWKLFKLNRDTYSFTAYVNDPNNSKSISSSLILSIYEDEKGRLWFGTFGGGLNKFNRESNDFESYTIMDGLPNNAIHGILEDKDGNLWLSTNNGLSKFNPENETFRNYNVDNGLVGNQFFSNACSKSKDGEMYFGSTRGLVTFYPERLKDNLHIPNIVITDFQAFNKSVPIQKENAGEENNSFALPKPAYLLDEITLPYKENVFSFEFAALDYRSPQKNQYAYKMEGIDPEWVHTDATRRFATYTNLDPGQYVFKVKGSNNDGIWNEEGTSIKIIILPPWWRTSWAYSLYTLLILSLVYGVWRFRINRLKMKHEMEMEHFEAEKLREVDHLKSQFFANISHEFRTPLTLIQGPVKQMFSGEFKGNLKETSGMILCYSDRLLNLINQILDLSKLESGRMTLRVTCMDVIKFLKGIVQSFASLAERKKITLKFKADDEPISGYLDRDKLEKVVTNLLSNAFKFTPEGGKVYVDCQLRSSSSKARKVDLEAGKKFEFRNSNYGILQISIFNTGPVIPPDQLEKIFDRFYQADESYQKDSEGTGIGLALTKEMVEAHHGEIQVESELNKGTTFTVWLPIEKEHFKPEEIVDIPREELTPLSPPLLRGEETGVETSRPAPIKQHLAASTSAPLLLIVEDNPDVTTFISSFLEKDYCIITAENGEVGLNKTLKKFPDLIISDVMMPVMDGFELCKKLKSDENTSHIPVILLTAKADMESKIEGLEFGADDYVTKPFDAKELHVRVKNLIEQRKKLHEKFSRMIEVKPAEIATSSMDEQFLERLLNVFEAHVDESDFSTEDFAREVGMSRSSLHRKLQALTNQPTHEFLRTLRLKRAAQLLKQSTRTVTEIAYAVGFNSPSHFSRIFHQQFGQTPSEFASKNTTTETSEEDQV